MRVMRTNVEMRVDARIVNESKLKGYNYIRIYIYNIVISDFGISLLSRSDEKISLQGGPFNRVIFDSSLVYYGRKMFAR